MMQNRTILRQSQFRLALLQNSVEHNPDRRRRAASAAYGATTPRRMAMRHGEGRGAEEKVRGTEPSDGFAARRRKRAGRGYMLPLPVWNTGGLCGNECCRKGRAEPLPYLPTTSAAPKISRLRRGKAATRSRFSGLSVRPGSLLKPEPRRPEGTPAYSSSMFLTYMPPSSSASSAAFLSWASRCSRAFCRRARCMASR